jgi:hypothetical protein
MLDYKTKIIIITTLLALALVAVFRPALFVLFLSTLAFSPVGGTAYAVANGFSNVQTVVAMVVANMVIAVFWLLIVGLFTNRVAMLLHIDKRQKSVFRQSSLVGLLVASFVLGSLWAVILLYVFRIDKLRGLMCIIVGSTVGGLLWTLGALRVIPFLPSPWWLYLLSVVVTVLLLSRKIVGNLDQIGWEK